MNYLSERWDAFAITLCWFVGLTGDRPDVQRVGARITMYYKGEPVMELTQMPLTGPVLSVNEVTALRKAEYDALLAKRKAGSDSRR